METFQQIAVALLVLGLLGGLLYWLRAKGFAVFGVKDELVATIEDHHEPVMPDGKPANGPWHVMTYDFKMNPGRGAVPRPLMPAAE